MDTTHNSGGIPPTIPAPTRPVAVCASTPFRSTRRRGFAAAAPA
jgi:hypothetical protein